jgi:hypothetical protein
MEGTTSLEDLPTSPQSEGNIQLETTEKNVKIDSTINDMRVKRQAEISEIGKGPSNVNTGDPTGLGENVNKFVTGVQEAVAAGALGLESRDVPQNQTHLTQDEQMQPNYVPKQQEDYITASNQSNNDIIRLHNEKKQNEENLDILFNNLQTPVLLAVLYFIFQLPIVKQTILRVIPSLFRKDGTPNLYGYIFHAILFASMYQIITMTLHYFSI